VSPSSLCVEWVDGRDVRRDVIWFRWGLDSMK
jgi:hypothetical protein